MSLLKSPRIIKRNEAKQKLTKISENEHKILIVHYSCESFFNLKGRTPRITSICIKNRESGESKIFSIHLQAQFSKIDLSNANHEQIDDLEKEMLMEFRKFVELHRDYYWIHWNMRNATYGFEAISNRSRIVNSEQIDIDSDRKIELLNIIIQLYTKNFEKDEPNGKMLNLADLNKISTRDALKGADEAEAFDKADYLKLHMSTMRKVEVIDRILVEVETSSLKVKSNKREIYGLNLRGIYTLIKESPLLFAIWSLIIFVIGSILEIKIQDLFDIFTGS